MSFNMHSKDSSRRIGRHLKQLSAAVASALVFMSGADAAGLGKLTVLSALGQPLRAEIEVTSAGGDDGALNAKLASQAAFRQANIDFNPALMSLRFAVEPRGSGSVIKVSSTQPINEPFIDMLLELSSGNSHLVREYTFLLDPADLRLTQAPQVAQPVSVPTPAVSASRPPVRVSEPAARPAAPAERERPRDYEVKKGDSLAAIANRVKPAGVALDQMLVALYRANPDAFIDKNMNRLRAGQVLTVPDAQAAHSVAPAEAHGIVVAQTRDFNEYRSRLAAQAAASTAKPAAEARQSAAGRITSTVEEPAGAGAEAQDRLKLSRANATGNAGAAAGAGATGTEELVAKDKALNDANARIRELEKNLADLQKLLEIKNKGLAGQQQQASGAEAAAASSAAAKPEASADAKPEVKPETAADAKPEAAAAPDGAAAKAEAAKPEAGAAPAESPKPAKPVKRPPPPPPAPEPGFFDSLTENPLLLPGAGLLLVALGAFGIYNSRRRKKQKPFTDSILADSSLKANSLFGSTGGQSVDTNNSVFNSSFSPSASQLDTNEVDPVAEADVYIAYGRDAQAEEILKEALRTQPERHPVRLKLLEIYANRKDARAFELLASEMYAMTKGEGDDWGQAAALGLSVDPANPMYAGGKLSEAAAAKVAAIAAPTEPLEELDLDALLATTQPHSIIRTSDSVDTTPPDDMPALDEVTLPLPEDEPVPVAASTAAPKPATNEVADLDFDLGDFGSQIAPAGEPPVQEQPLPDVSEPVTSAEQPASAPAQMPALDFGTLDFDLTPAAAPAPAAAETATENLQEAAPALEPEHQPLADEAAPLTAAAEPAAEPAPLMPAPAPEPAPAPIAAPSLDFDLEGIDLDLGGPADEGADPYSAEMSTKLDLALAYREIGDKEGARELLDEVVRNGSQQQAEKARSLLAELA